MARHVFISHSSVDASLATRICRALEAKGLSCWIAPRDVKSEGTYGREILRGLRECESFLIIVTVASAASEQVEREAERATQYKKRIVPVIVGGTDPGLQLEYYLAGRQRVECSSTPDDKVIDGIADVLRGRTYLQQEPVAESAPKRKLILFGVAAGIAVVGAVAWTTLGRRGPVTEQPPPTLSVPAVGAPARGKNTESEMPPSTKAAASGATDLQARNPGRPTSASRPVPRQASAMRVVEVDGQRMSFVPIPPGTFAMGCSNGDVNCYDDERPVRPMTVGAMEMSATEVPQALWEAVMGSNPSDFKGEGFPVEHVSWLDAQAFANRLTQRHDGFAYRLPTEAEWEYAARATAPNTDLASVAWFALASAVEPDSRPQRVATKRANALGLYDMFGNVAEWCQDWYSPNYQRVIRGGSWLDTARSLRASARAKAVPTTREYSIGVRLVRTTVDP